MIAVIKFRHEFERQVLQKHVCAWALYTKYTPPQKKSAIFFLPLYVNGSITKVANGCLYEYFYLKNAFRAYVYYTGRHFEDTKLKK